MTQSTRLYALVSSPGELKVRHEIGMPKSLSPLGDEPTALPSARVLIIEERPDGVFLLRYSSQAEFAGDTWHQTVADAKDQAAFEFDVVPAWLVVPPSEIPTRELIQFLLAADKGELS
jgi:hypothetical protein